MHRLFPVFATSSLREVCHFGTSYLFPSASSNGREVTLQTQHFTCNSHLMEMTNGILANQTEHEHIVALRW